MLSWFANGANAQTLEGVDDNYGVPFGQTLQVETYGVLENDSLDDESAGESGATAELINSPGHGTLSCPANTDLELCADGSFDYAPGVGFNGIDSFTYQAVFGNTISAIVTVNLTACNGGPQIFDCWKEAAYLRKLAEYNYGVFYEGFESAAWDVARSPATVPSVTTQEITWTSNHPDTNNITTGPGPARTGNWGAFDRNHGVATGVPENCDIDNPPDRCLYFDGLTGKTQPAGEALHGVSAYITGIYGAKMVVILDGITQIDLGLAGSGRHQFFGVVDTGASGFRKFEFREVDGKVGQALYVWFDDFILSANGLPTNIAPVSNAGPDQAISTNGLVQLDGGASFDANSDWITYSWSLTDSPALSTAVLSDSSVVDPTFVANVAGSYVAQLIVTDVHGSGSTDTVEIFATAASSNILPVADAGADQTTVPDEFVVLDGSASFDGNNDPLVFHWLLIEIPAASAASVSDPGAEYPIFFADVLGRYVAQLVVSDAVGNSPPDTVEIIARDPSVSTFFVIPLPDGGAAVFDL